MPQRWIIPDVHGCTKTLKVLLENMLKVTKHDELYFLGDYIDEDDPGIVTAIEEAKKAGAEVEYMDIVVSINGQVVRRGSTSIEGLPKGLYIINGKKYFVK
jgi:hypothetical protein